MPSAESSAHLAPAACVVWHTPGGPADAHVAALMASLRKRAASVCVCADRFGVMARGLRLAGRVRGAAGGDDAPDAQGDGELIVVLVDPSRLTDEATLRATLPCYVPAARFLAFALNEQGRPTLTRIRPEDDVRRGDDDEQSGGSLTRTPPKQPPPTKPDSRGAAAATNPQASGPRMEMGGRSTNLRRQAQPRLRLAGTGNEEPTSRDQGDGPADIMALAPGGVDGRGATGDAGSAGGVGSADDARPGDLLTPEEWSMLLGDEPGTPPGPPTNSPPTGPGETDERGGAEGAGGARAGGMG